MPDSDLAPSETAVSSAAAALPVVLPGSEKVSGWTPAQGAEALPSPLRDLAAAARAYAAKKDSANTRRAYDSDWRQFARCAGARGLMPTCRTRKRSGST